jgi:hypothetical protein
MEKRNELYGANTMFYSGLKELLNSRNNFFKSQPHNFQIVK